MCREYIALNCLKFAFIAGPSADVLLFFYLYHRIFGGFDYVLSHGYVEVMTMCIALILLDISTVCG